MIKCSVCNSEYKENEFQYCRKCGNQLSSDNEAPTRRLHSKKAKTAKTLQLKTNPSLESENERLRKEIEKLKKTSENRFGKREERAEDRVERILTVTGFEENILGKVDVSYYSPEDGFDFRTKRIRYRIRSFHLYTRPPENDQDDTEVVYVAHYENPVDFEKELADVRVLLSEMADQGIGGRFWIATNEDLSSHRKLILKNFTTIKSFLPIKVRKNYSLEILDSKPLLEKEYELRIKVRPQRNNRPKEK